MLEVEVSKSGRDFLQLHLTIRNVNLEENWKLEIVLYLHEGTKGEREYSRDTFVPPLEKYLRLQPLPSESMFKVVAIFSNKQRTLKSTVYTFTKAKDDDAVVSTGSEAEQSNRVSRRS